MGIVQIFALITQVLVVAPSVLEFIKRLVDLAQKDPQEAELVARHATQLVDTCLDCVAPAAKDPAGVIEEARLPGIR